MADDADHALVNSYSDGPVWSWFGLSYSAYLVLPRVLLCSAPWEWQVRFVRMLLELEAMFPNEEGREYWVRLRDDRGRFVADPFSDYRHHGRVDPATSVQRQGE
jgi:hypothetical protein